MSRYNLHSANLPFPVRCLFQALGSISALLHKAWQLQSLSKWSLRRTTNPTAQLQTKSSKTSEENSEVSSRSHCAAVALSLLPGLAPGASHAKCTGSSDSKSEREIDQWSIYAYLCCSEFSPKYVRHENTPFIRHSRNLLAMRILNVGVSNFERPVLGCTKTNLDDRILLGKRLTRSITSTHSSIFSHSSR